MVSSKDHDPTGVVKVDKAQDSGISLESVPEVVLQHCGSYVLVTDIVAAELNSYGKMRTHMKYKV